MSLCLTHGDEKLHARLEETTSKWDVKKKFKTIESDDLAFDHELILADAIVQLRKWITETHIAFRLLPEKFTLRELQQIHETVLDTKLLVPAFRRKVADRVEDTGEMTGMLGIDRRVVSGEKGEIMCVKRKLFRYRSFDNEIVNDYSYIHQKRMVNVEKWKFEAFEGLVYPSSPLFTLMIHMIVNFVFKRIQ